MSTPAEPADDDRALVRRPLVTRERKVQLSGRVPALRGRVDEHTGQPIAARRLDVHPGGGENMHGIFGTPAVDREGRRLYVCVGGYVPADGLTTPFVRAVHSNTFNDAWPGAFGPDAVWRYTAAAPPLYTSGSAAWVRHPSSTTWCWSPPISLPFTPSTPTPGCAYGRRRG